MSANPLVCRGRDLNLGSLLGRCRNLGKIDQVHARRSRTAIKLWASLPAETRKQLPLPESVMALFIAKNYPADWAGYQETGDRMNGPTPDYWLVQFQYPKR